jgi:hypothetical protein
LGELVFSQPARLPLQHNGVCIFPRNFALVSVLYFGERLEMTCHDEKPRKAKTRKKN